MNTSIHSFLAQSRKKNLQVSYDQRRVSRKKFKWLLFFFLSFNLDADTSRRSLLPRHLKGSPHISGFQMMCSPDGSPTPAHSSSCWRQSCQRTSPRSSGLWARDVKDSKQMQVTWNSCTQPKQLSTKAIDRRCCLTMPKIRNAPDLRSPEKDSLFAAFAESKVKLRRQRLCFGTSISFLEQK